MFERLLGYLMAGFVAMMPTLMFGMLMLAGEVKAFAEEAVEKVGGYMDTTYIADADLWQRMSDAIPEWALALVPIAIAISVACRALSEILLSLEAVIPGENDKKIAGYLKSASGWIARVLGWIGIGIPKRLLMEKAEKEAQKDLSK